LHDKVERGRADLVVANAESVARELLWNDESLSDLEISGIQLEEAFLALTQPVTQAPEAA
jgi:hypothetical protein